MEVVAIIEGRITMWFDPSRSPLNFVNPSRYFDAKRGQVCFSGHNGALEISFFGDVSLLQNFNIETNGSEAGFLKAFDDGLAQIHGIAEKVYRRDGKDASAYILTAEDI